MPNGSAIEIIGAVLIVVAAFLGVCALFSDPKRRGLLLGAGVCSALAAIAVGFYSESLLAALSELSFLAREYFPLGPPR